MIIDVESGVALPEHADVLVIGSGPVGILLTIALARAGRRVILAECGGRAFEARSQDLNLATVAGRPHKGVWEGRGRVLGGTSTLWGGQLIPFREIDFKARPWLDLPAWPIGRTDLASHFEQASRMLGLPLVDDDDSVVWQSLGIPRPDFGDELDLVVTKWLKQPNLARHFTSELKTHPNITVLAHACAVGFQNEGATVTGVPIRSPGGREAVLRCGQIVVANGTIEASRLMLASALRNPELPWAGNRWVGLGFQDHLDIAAASVEPIDKRGFDDIFDNIFIKGYKYNPKVMLASAVQEARQVTNVAAGMQFHSSLSEHLGNIKIFLGALRSGSAPENWRELPRHMIALAKVWWPLVKRYLRDNRMFNPADGGIRLHVHCEQRPLDTSRVTLDMNHHDANGMPRTRLEWQVDGREIETVALFCEKVAARFAASGLARVIVDPDIAARDPAALDRAQDTNHHCGGLRMAAAPDRGVVDANLKVFGTDNLFVAGAAVFPSSSFANPTFTAMALALRLADHLAAPTP